MFVSAEKTKSKVQVKIERQFKIEKEIKVSLKRELKLDSMLGFKPKNEKTQGQFSTAWKLLVTQRKMCLLRRNVTLSGKSYPKQ